jgi:nucleoside-diphosphate-sugar epimerase
MKVVLTGATGFVGSALARRLFAEGAAVHGLALPSSNRQTLAGYPITWHTGDITRPETLRGLFANAEWVIHAAGLLGRAGIVEQTYCQINAEGTRHLLQEAADSGNGRLRILHISSAGVLGPIRYSHQWVQMDESSPLAPSNAYERSKALAEQYVQQFVAQGLPVIVARPEFVYGPGDTHVLGLFRAIQRGLFFYIGNGRNTCHPTYVDDMVEGVLRCLRGGRPGEVYHITGPRALTFHELATTMATALGVPPPRWRVPVSLARAGATILELAGELTGRDVPLSRTGVAFFSENRRSTSTKAEHDLGFVPQVDLEEGIGRTVAWYREEGLL